MPYSFYADIDIVLLDNLRISPKSYPPIRAVYMDISKIDLSKTAFAVDISLDEISVSVNDEVPMAIGIS